MKLNKRKAVVMKEGKEAIKAKEEPSEEGGDVVDQSGVDSQDDDEEYSPSTSRTKKQKTSTVSSSRKATQSVKKPIAKATGARGGKALGNKGESFRSGTIRQGGVNHGLHQYQDPLLEDQKALLIGAGDQFEGAMTSTHGGRTNDGFWDAVGYVPARPNAMMGTLDPDSDIPSGLPLGTYANIAGYGDHQFTGNTAGDDMAPYGDEQGNDEYPIFP
jgi:hypothetical protein